MKIAVLLTKLGEPQKKQPLTDSIRHNLARLKEISLRQFSNQRFYGNAALNRMMLLNPDVAHHLTPDVIRYLFSNEPTDATTIRRTGGSVSLRDILFHGFSSGLQTIKLMPNNEQIYGPREYKTQQHDFNTNTMLIIENMINAVGDASIHIEMEDTPKGISLITQFELIIRTINQIKIEGQSNTLLTIPDYTPQQMRDQVERGFEAIYLSLGLSLKMTTLESFCEAFLKSPTTMLNGQVIHLFYDRAHIEAALEQDTRIQIGEQSCTYQDIFRTMVSKVATHPEQYPACAKEQFNLRFSLVNSDLNNRFPAIVSRVKETLPTVELLPKMGIDPEKKAMFVQLVKDINAKRFKFYNNKNHKAVAAVGKLYAELNAASQLYFTEPSDKSYNVFMHSCNSAIKNASELKQHRGWGEFFAKLVLAIACLTIIPLIIPITLAIVSKQKTGSYSFLLFKTDSAKKIEAVSKNIDELAPKTVPIR